MRYVQVWFKCSAKNCHEMSECLVEARMPLDYGAPSRPSLNREILPPGWGTVMAGLNTLDDRQDREHTYCPKHAEQ